MSHWVVILIKLTKRQQSILRLVKEKGPITGDGIGNHFNLTRATLRPDLTILTMMGLLAARPRVGYYYPGSEARTMLEEQMDSVSLKTVTALPLVIETGRSAYDAIVSLFLEDHSTLFVVDESGGLVGVVTSKDLLKLSMGGSDLHKLPVELVMTRYPQVEWLDEKASLLDAINKLAESQVECLPVLKEGKIPTGRFDRSAALDLLQELARGDFEEGIYG